MVIANSELGFEEATVPVLRQLFLGRRSELSGRRVHCFEPAPGTPLRRAFSRLVLDLSERELERYWLEQALSGGPVPPREIADEAELVEHVASRHGAVAYLGWAAFERLPRKRGVRLVRVRDGERLLGPEDPAYPLRFEAPQEPGAGGRNEGG